MSDYYPDRFLLVEIEYPDETLMKVFGTWSGGYLSGDSWRMNSGVSTVKTEGDMILFGGYTGSIYHCYLESYGSTAYGSGILNSMVEKAKVPIRVLSEEEMIEYVEKMQ